jgi:hypothetical protein
VSRLPAVDLPTVLSAAALQRRVDRKYLVPSSDVPRVLEALGETHRVLEIDGRRSTRYRSTYLDTADLRACRDHVQGRRLRWKARSRLYVEDGLCRFEVKLRNGRGETVKHALDLGPDSYGCYGPAEGALLQQVLGTALDLEPVLEVTYTRTTLVDVTAGTRLTVDRLVGAATVLGAGRLRPGTVTFDDDVVIVETKGGPRLAEADRALHALGHRPRALSKYATSAALLSEDVPDNDVRHLVGRHVVVQPLRSAS